MHTHPDKNQKSNENAEKHDQRKKVQTTFAIKLEFLKIVIRAVVVQLLECIIAG